MKNMMGRVVMLAVVSSACCLLTGCYWFHGAPKKQLAAEPLPASAWRVAISDEDERALRELAEATPVGSCPELPTQKRPWYETDSSDPRQRTIKAVEWHGGGLLRVWDEPGVTSKEPEEFTISFASRRYTGLLDIEFNAQFLMPDRFQKALAVLQTRRAVHEAFGLQPYQSTRHERDDNLELGLRLRLPDVVADDVPGLVVYLPALFANTYEYSAVQAFRDRGWALLIVDGKVQVEPANQLAIVEAQAKQSAHRLHVWNEEVTQWKSAGIDQADYPVHAIGDSWQLHEEAVGLYPEPPSGFSYELWDDHAELGRAIAAAVDELLLEYALGAEAAVGLLRERFPSLQGKPIVLMGFSGGSLATPAIAAKLHEAFPDSPMAMVLVGSGGDLLSIALDSDTSNGNIVLAPKGEAVPAAVRAAVVQAYREASQLDPLRAVAAVRHLPLLHVYASGDKAVPTARARELNAAHGQAARITYLGGHFGMFYFLPGQRGRIANWAERAVRKPAS